MKKTATALVPAMTLGLTVLFFGPLLVFIKNAAELRISLGTAAMYYGLVTGLLILALAVVQIMVPRRMAKPLQVAMVAISAAIFIQNSLIPFDIGVLDGRDKVFSFFAIDQLDLLIWVAAVPVIYLLATRSRVSLQLLCGYIVVCQLLFLAADAIPHYFNAKDRLPSFQVMEDNKYSFSKEKNVLFLMVDTYQSNIFSETLQDTKTREHMTGFTFYRNATSSFPSTTPSIPVMLTGVVYRHEAPIETLARTSLESDTSIPKVLKAQGWNVELYANMKFLYQNAAGEIADNLVLDTNNFDHNVKGLASVFDAYLLRAVPYILKSVVFDEGNLLVSQFFFDDSATEEDGDGKGKRPFSYHDFDYFDEFTERASVELDRPSFKFLRLIGLHPPLLLDDNLEPHRRIFSFENVVDFAKTYNRSLVRVFDKLRSMGIFDQTMIVVLGDHGAYVDVKLGDLPFPDGARPTGYGAGLPLIMIKPFGASGALKISDDPIAMRYLPEIVANVNAGGTVEQVLDRHAGEPRYFFDYLSRTLSALAEIEVRGHSWLASSWRPTGTIITEKGEEIRVDPVELGDTVELVDKPYYLGGGWSSIMIPENRRGIVWSGRRNVYLSIPVVQSDEPLALVMEIEPADFVAEKSRQRVHVYLRDQLLKEFIVDKKGSYRVEIPASHNELLELRLQLQDAYRPYDFVKKHKDYNVRAIGLESFAVVRR
ncbi:MAG: sulfatase-like hydrolase/transferase [Myxococcales bacterium]|nr:sulfatase-like hydrolase/transferase [Myxococcales bacterium]